MGRAMANYRGFTIRVIAIGAFLAQAATASRALAQSAGQETFKTPQAAAAALFEAAKNRDKPMALKVLGPNSEDLFNTGDPEVDTRQHQMFVDKYQQASPGDGRQAYRYPVRGR